MSENISYEPQIKNDISPNIPNTAVAFILKNYKVDQIMINQINCTKFMHVFNINISDIPSQHPTIKPIPYTFQYDKYSLNLENWCKIDQNEEIFNAYSFLQKYNK